jgi:anti-sigma regulatory factor (Ser/Thr protein kinase)
VEPTDPTAEPLVLVLARNRNAPSLARHQVSEAVDHLLTDARRADLELLVSEVVSNAVLHGAGDITVVIGALADAVRIEVRDGNPALPEETASTGAHGGFGLRLLAQLSSSWGVDARSDGKTVWFCL